MMCGLSNPMTLNDFQDHAAIASHLKCDFMQSCAAGNKILTVVARRAVPRLSAVSLSGNDLGQVAHRCLCHEQYNLVPDARQRCPATGKVTVDLASHWPCVTKWFIHLRAQGLSKEDEHPTNTLHRVCTFYLYR